MSYTTDYKVKPPKAEPWPPVGEGWRKARRRSAKWCNLPTCDYKVKGPNHKSGQHHKDALTKASA